MCVCFDTPKQTLILFSFLVLRTKELDQKRERASEREIYTQSARLRLRSVKEFENATHDIEFRADNALRLVIP